MRRRGKKEKETDREMDPSLARELKDLPAHERLVEERGSAVGGESDSDDEKPLQEAKDEREEEEEEDWEYHSDEDEELLEDTGGWFGSRWVARWQRWRRNRNRITIYDGGRYRTIDANSVMAPLSPTKEIVRALSLLILGIVLVGLGGWIWAQEPDWKTRGICIVLLGLIMLIPGSWHSFLVLVSWFTNDWSHFAHVIDDD